ncbi:TetR/AcrR family transcriptional regulator [Nocardioides marmoriginsengisoli]|uniref:TetR/AcrR family transcriptional regulator n=1 Tax=Nocardioides marmoriginsengisoli TaxID=661483 RepID=UPI00162048DA|nr:TetR/AcrR family transcriptional regulator [Nocardioides marmoriginsengisoli]
MTSDSPRPPDDADETRWERTRQRILEAAATILSQRGVAGTSVAAVAQEADLNAPAIYYYFTSREELIAEVVVSGTVRLRDRLEFALAQAPAGLGPIDLIEIAIAAHLRQLMAESGFAHAVIRNVTQFPPGVREKQQAEERKYNGVWRGLFKDAEAAGVLREELDVKTAHLLLVGSLNWATEWWTERACTLDALVHDAQVMFRHGFIAEAAR